MPKIGKLMVMFLYLWVFFDFVIVYIKMINHFKNFFFFSLKNT